MILFETTESVVEVLWDVALAFFVVRLAAVYFLLNFLSACALSYLALAGYTPVTHLIALPSDGVLVPFLLASAALWARVLIVHYEIPRAAWFRLGIGAVALVLMALAEAVVGWVVYEEGWWQTEVWERLIGGEERVWMILSGVLGWYALMPWCMMFFEAVEVKEVEEPAPVEGKRPAEKAEKN